MALIPIIAIVPFLMNERRVSLPEIRSIVWIHSFIVFPYIGSTLWNPESQSGSTPKLSGNEDPMSFLHGDLLNRNRLPRLISGILIALLLSTHNQILSRLKDRHHLSRI